MLDNLEYRVTTLRDRNKRMIAMFSDSTGTVCLNCPRCGLVRDNFKQNKGALKAELRNGHYLEIICPKCSMHLEFDDVKGKEVTL